MTYLDQILAKYRSDESGVKAEVARIFPAIKKWDYFPYVINSQYSGSIAKGTATSLSSDADVFLSLRHDTPGNLPDYFKSLYAHLTAEGLSARPQNVSVGVQSNTFLIDVVPARRQHANSEDHSLYLRRFDSWRQTNVETHISHIRAANRASEIRLAKIWRDLRKLDFPSFYLELVAVDTLKGKRVDMESGFWAVLGAIADDAFPRRTYIDPANTNNIVSDELSTSQKRELQAAASDSRERKEWHEVIW
jgi:hypothetical protein